MPTIAKNEGRQLESGVRNISSSSVYAQPWWRGFESNSMPSPEDTVTASVTPGNIQSQGNGEGGTKERETSVAPQSGSNGFGGQERQHLNHVASSTVPMPGDVDATSQMELVGHSIMLTPYPYADPQYGTIMTYGAPVHPQLLGLHQTRMPLPLQMEEEPVFVNAKQYHGILRRRQSRAKAEMEKKVIKARKPYLHESRHQHAMRRARGTGGRFLKTKKGEGNAPNSTSQEQTKSGAASSAQSGNSSGSEYLATESNGNSDQQVERDSRVQPMYKEHIPSNGNSNCHRNSSLHFPQSTGTEQGKHHFNQESWNLLVNQPPHGAASSN